MLTINGPAPGGAHAPLAADVGQYYSAEPLDQSTPSLQYFRCRLYGCCGEGVSRDLGPDLES